MAISKKTRVAVYKKFDGHCAYCGRHIAYNDMQVDHFKPQRAWNPEDSGTDDIENLMPSCRMCNHYKRAHDLETFRQYIAEIPRKLQENYIYKVGVVYGNVLENPKAIKFYFEKVRDNHAFEVFDATCQITKGIGSGKTAAYFYGDGCRKVLEAIDAAPTIDPESLRPTAHWIKRGYVCGENEYECSACHQTEWRTSASRMKYCMFCGARMVNTDEKHCT